MKATEAQTELIAAKQKPTAIQRQPDASPMSLIAAMDMSTIDPDKLEKMLEIQAKWEDRQSEKQLAAAMADFQKSAPAITKTRQSDKSMYASMDDIMLMIREPLGKCGLSVSFDTGVPAEGTLSVTCHVMHAGGAKFSRIVTVPVDKQMRVNDTQKMGSALSYARRYAIVAALNLIVTDYDDDGKAGGTEFLNEMEVKEVQAIIAKFPDKDRDGILTRMLEWVGVETIPEIPAAKFPSVMSNLKKKLGA